MNDNISWKTLNTYFKDNANFQVKHHLDSYNLFFNQQLRDIIQVNNPIHFFKEQDEETKQHLYNYKIYIAGKNADKIYYGKPIIYDEKGGKNTQHYMYPNEARLRNMTYSITIHVDIEVESTLYLENNSGKTGMEKFDVKNETFTLKNIFLGRFPIMVQSDLCILKNMDKTLRYNLGECKNDPGGYFIIDGKEKVIVSQESRADNMLYVTDKGNDIYTYSAEIRSVSEDTSKPTRTLAVKIVAPTPTKKNGNIVVNIPNVRMPIPLFIVMRALGVISDKEIIETCILSIDNGGDYLESFRPSVHDASVIYTQHVALKYIATFTKGKTIKHVLEILTTYFLPHIGENNFKTKSLYLGYIVKTLLDVVLGKTRVTDRDSYKCKRLETSGLLINKLFREYYTLQLNDYFLKMDKEYNFHKNSYQEDKFVNLIKNNQNILFENRVIETGFKKAFKGNWGATPHTKKIGALQDLNRLSFFSFICQLRKTNIPMSADSAKIIPPRYLHSTQWGLLCPLHSPDGGNVGLHNHMSVLANITSGESSKKYIHYLRLLGVKLLEECKHKYLFETTKVFINGMWLGNTDTPIELVKIFKLHRRNNIVNIYTSIHFNIKQNEILIWTDGGRLIRPLFYIENGKISCERDEILSQYKKNTIKWDTLIKGYKKYPSLDDPDFSLQKISNTKSLYKTQNVIEFLDTTESEGMVLPKTKNGEKQIKNTLSTHHEIHPSCILGFMANQIIFPENNPYPRNAFSCGQSKQAVSMYHTNFQNRIDKTALVLNYGQLPITKTRYFEKITNNEHPYGENAIVAIMCYSGFNVEDAIIINKGSIQRGLFNTTYYNSYEDHEELENVGGSKKTSLFMNIENSNVTGLKVGYDYSKLDEDTGIIKENEIVDQHTIIIGKATLDPVSKTYIDSSVVPKKGQVGIVDKAFITTDEEGKRIAKVRIRAIRLPKTGDKFCSRAGQKGTVGFIMESIDMPTTSSGVVPDIIVNPHAMPSRMTIGHLVETLTSKVNVYYGGHGDCTAFMNNGPKHEILGEMLNKIGFHKSGNEILYNGQTGEQLETSIYFGPTYYLRLKHMPKDKINYRARGPRTVLTRQTVHGRANNGGLRIGEMDRDCLIAHGMSEFMNDSMMNRGDHFSLAVCNKTGCVAIYNKSKNIFLSPSVDGPLKFNINHEDKMNVINVSKHGRDFSIVEMPYCFKLLMQELKTMNIEMRIVTDKNVDNLLNMVNSDNIKKLTGMSNYSEVFDKNKRIFRENRIRNIKRHKRQEKQAPKKSNINIQETIEDVVKTMENIQKFQPMTPETPPPDNISTKFQPMTPETPPQEGTPPEGQFGLPETPPEGQFGLPETPPEGQFGLPETPPETPPEGQFGLPETPPETPPEGQFGLPETPDDESKDIELTTEDLTKLGLSDKQASTILNLDGKENETIIDVQYNPSEEGKGLKLLNNIEDSEDEKNSDDDSDNDFKTIN
jgi:DNA-directed RNA polymerase II subunit RPB2